MTELRLSPAIFLKSAQADSAGRFSGYASTFGGQPDSYGDIIAAGAFAKSLTRHQAQDTMPALLWAHDGRTPIGKWVSMREDAHGLKVEGKLTLEVEKAREAHALMKDGALGLSIGFRVPAGGASFGKSGDRVLTEVDLAEVSVVALPANTNARITGVKSIRDFESVLRDELGFSAREARRLASGGWRALEERDSLQFGAEDLLRAIAAKTNELDSLLRK